MNSFGRLFRLTSFGESHGKALGGVIDGCPAGVKIDLDFIQSELDRRRPSRSKFTTSRTEEDKPVFLSGIFKGKTTGTPIGFIVQNRDQKSADYDVLKDVYRPSHADFTYQQKYGLRDFRGGGRASARETVVRVVGGAVAKLLLKDSVEEFSKDSVEFCTYTSQIGEISLEDNYKKYDQSEIKRSPILCPDRRISKKMERLISNVAQKGDTIGGVVTSVISGVPVGWGEPLFDKLEARLAAAMLSIPAAKGFEYGTGFNTAYTGSEVNDNYIVEDGKIRAETNFSGGILGGISNGENIQFKVAFKPVPTILMEQKTVNYDGRELLLRVKGRHDPSVLPRAVPIVEAMAAMVLADFYLLHRTDRTFQ